MFRPLAGFWYVMDNSGTSPQLIMDKSIFEKLNIQEQKAFAEKFKVHTNE